GGKLYSYIAETNTLNTTYSDEDGDTPNSNPIVLDANGRCQTSIYLGSGKYKFVLKDANDNIIWTRDKIQGGDDSSSSGWSTHEITEGQSATDLDGETVDL